VRRNRSNAEPRWRKADAETIFVLHVRHKCKSVVLTGKEIMTALSQETKIPQSDPVFTPSRERLPDF